MSGIVKSLHGRRVSPYLLRRRRSLEEAWAEVGSRGEREVREPEDDRERIGNRTFER